MYKSKTIYSIVNVRNDNLNIRTIRDREKERGVEVLLFTVVYGIRSEFYQWEKKV